MSKTVILCVGGDQRYIYTCGELCRYGKVYSYGINGAVGDIHVLSSLDSIPEKADMLVLPMLSGCGLDIPLSDGKTVSCCALPELLNKNAYVIGGRLNTEVIEYFSALGHDVADYFTREELVIRNCVPTAEGALQIAMCELAVTIDGTKTLIVGYGRVAKACAKLFKAVGSQVTVAARRLAQLAQAENDGCIPLQLAGLKKGIDKFDTIINTVPALVLARSELECMQKNSLVIDLASKPGGVDFEAAQRLNRRVIHALALPGKSAPATSGRIIAEAVMNIFIERREMNVFKRH